MRIYRVSFTSNPPTKIIPTKIRGLIIFGKSPTDMRIPTLDIQIPFRVKPSKIQNLGTETGRTRCSLPCGRSSTKSGMANSGAKGTVVSRAQLFSKHRLPPIKICD